MKQKIIIIGASGHAKVIIDIIEKESKYEILGITDISLKKGDVFFGYRVLGNDDDLLDILGQNQRSWLFIAIGDNWKRAEVFRKLNTLIPDAKYASVIHPSAEVGRDVEIGQGVAVMAGAVINSGTTIGDFVIINTRCSLDHDNMVHAYASIAPGVVSGGNVTVGEFSAISIGATLRHNIVIGRHSVIGGSSFVSKNVEDYCVVFGVPARVIRKRDAGDTYL